MTRKKIILHALQKHGVIQANLVRRLCSSYDRFTNFDMVWSSPQRVREDEVHVTRIHGPTAVAPNDLPFDAR